MTKLFLRLYFFAVVIMVTSGLISSSVIDLVYRHDRRPGPPPEVLGQVQNQMQVFKTLMPAEPAAARALLRKLAVAQNWDLSVWQSGKLIAAWGGPPLDAELAARLIARQPVAASERPLSIGEQIESPPADAPAERRAGPPGHGPFTRQASAWTAVPFGRQWLLIHPKPPMRGAPPIRHLILPILVTSLILMVLLIPFVRRIVMPFQHLLASIRRVSVGNYETTLKLRPGSEFEALAAEFNHMMEQIKKTLAEKQRLIADVSHELRSPLARLRLSLELMAKKGTVPEKYFNRAVAEVEQLDALIDDLLDSSRLELRAHFSPKTTEMGQFIQLLIDKNQVLFTEQQMEVRFRQPEQPIWCDVDRDLLERAFNNVMSNSLKYAQPPAFLDIRLSADQGAIELRFRDNGPGVAPADCAKIFDPFYRTDDSRTRSTGGVGLGLSIVSKIVQLHRGEVWASLPEDGQGGLIIGMRLPALVVTAPTQTGEFKNQAG